MLKTTKNRKKLVADEGSTREFAHKSWQAARKSIAVVSSKPPLSGKHNHTKHSIVVQVCYSEKTVSDRRDALAR